MPRLRLGAQEVKRAGGYRIKKEIIADFDEILRRARKMYLYLEVQEGISYKHWLLEHAVGIINIAKKYVEE